MALFSACTQRINGDGQDFEALVIFHNEVGSSVKVSMRRLTVQLDAVAATSTLFVPALTYRGSDTPATLGGLNTQKMPFDTNNVSDSHVKMWSAITPDGSNDAGMYGTPGVLTWRKWCGKMRALDSQVISDDQSMLPTLIQNNSWILYPGEYIIVRVDPVALADNTNTNGWFVNCVWEETALSTFTISGTVTLSGSGVVGAEVTVLVADDTNLTNAYLHSIQTTTTGGAWSADIPVGKLAYAYATNFSSGTYYTAEGRPFIT